MISVEQATEIILKTAKSLDTEYVNIQSANGRILRESVVADRDFPPFDRVTMDGIAIRYETFLIDDNAFPIESTAAAGAPQEKLKNPLNCIEVMTGAMLPRNADTVIPYELVEIKDGVATIKTKTVKYRQNVARQGEDRLTGKRILRAGHVLSPAEVAVAATVGKSQLMVSQLPKTIIISSGDELIDIDKKPEPFQIRKSNVYNIYSELLKWGIDAEMVHLNDDKEAIHQALENIVQEYELVIMSGGVSMGKFDFFPQVLEDLKVEKLFHKVTQRPGKPFWFGQKKGGPVVFALPGNPVSTFVGVLRYVIPWLKMSLGLEPLSRPKAVLAEDHSFKPDLTYFLQVKIRYNEQGQIMAYPIKGHGSGDLAKLIDADAFIELKKGKEIYKKGEVYPIMFFRNPDLI